MTTPFGAIAAALEGFSQGRNDRRERERQAAKDAEEKQMNLLRRAALQMQLDAPEQVRARESQVAALADRLAGGDESAYGELSALAPSHPLVAERSRQRIADQQPETFGDFETVFDPATNKTRIVQRGNRSTVRDTGYEAPPKETPATRFGTATTDEGVFAFDPTTGSLGNRLGSRPRPQTPERREAPLPASAVDKLAGMDNLIAMGNAVKAALESAIKTDTDVTGRIGGVVPTPDWMKNAKVLGGIKGGDTGTDTRALIGNLYATLAKERGGTALSLNELRLLESYVPNSNEDEGRAVLKATRFVREMERLKAAKLNAYRKYGGRTFDDEAPMSDRPYGGVDIERPPED